MHATGRRQIQYKQHDWALRAAAYDDQRDREYEQQRADAAREVRERHAAVGRALVAMAVRRIREIEITKPADLIRLLDLAARMEHTATFGAEQNIAPASRAAIVAAGVPVDEWDRLAADLAATFPHPSRA